MRKEESRPQDTHHSNHVPSHVGPDAGAKGVPAARIISAKLRQILLTDVGAPQDELDFVIAVAGLTCLSESKQSTMLKDPDCLCYLGKARNKLWREVDPAQLPNCS